MDTSLTDDKGAVTYAKSTDNRPNSGQDQWTTVSKPNASVIIQERKLSDAFQKAIQESIDKGKKAYQTG